jgi:hypothetical protein
MIVKSVPAPEDFRSLGDISNMDLCASIQESPSDCKADS